MLVKGFILLLLIYHILVVLSLDAKNKSNSKSLSPESLDSKGITVIETIIRKTWNSERIPKPKVNANVKSANDSIVGVDANTAATDSDPKVVQFDDKIDDKLETNAAETVLVEDEYNSTQANLDEDDGNSNSTSTKQDDSSSATTEDNIVAESGYGGGHKKKKSHGHASKKGGSYAAAEKHSSGDYSGKSKHGGDDYKKYKKSGGDNGFHKGGKSYGKYGKDAKSHKKHGKFEGKKFGKKTHGGSGGQGGKKGAKNYKDKGYKKKGFKNVYHKEEFGDHKTYFDEFRDKDFKKKWKGHNDYYNYKGGKKWKGKDGKEYHAKKALGDDYKKYGKGGYKKHHGDEYKKGGDYYKSGHGAKKSGGGHNSHKGHHSKKQHKTQSKKGGYH